MELGIADLEPFLSGLDAALDDGEVSGVMINGPAAVSSSVAAGWRCSTRGS